MSDRIPVAVLGATGSVGQRFVQLLDRHPWFEVVALTGSERSAGQAYAQACRWVLPVEQSRDMLAALQARRPHGMETEVQVFGRLPLALSERCFTARAHHLPKDDCEFRCRDYPDGLALTTREGNRFLTLNGIQTQSGSSCNLAGAIAELRRLDVDVARLSPQSQHMDKIVQLFHATLEGKLSGIETERAISAYLPEGVCNGYWHGEPGMTWQPMALAD